MRTFVHQHIPSTTIRASATMLAPDAVSLWSCVFDNRRPVFVEVGPGRGEFLLRTARDNPDANYFGVERSRGRVRDIELRLAKHHGPSNVRVVNGDAACILALLPDACVAGYYVLFPDPWWKVRHHRRRLVTSQFIATLRRTLVAGGHIALATDVAGYFDVAQECLNADTGLERIDASRADAPSTSFSRKAQRLGTPIFCSLHCRREGG